MRSGRLAALRCSFHPSTGFSSSLVTGRRWPGCSKRTTGIWAAPSRRRPRPFAHMLGRFDRARDAVGAEPVTRQIGASIAAGLGATLEDEVGAFLQGLRTELVSHRPGSTVVIEFARGGPEGAAMPLSPPHGYAYTLPHLGDAMLEAASILHVSVTPGESKKRNLGALGFGACPGGVGPAPPRARPGHAQRLRERRPRVSHPRGGRRSGGGDGGRQPSDPCRDVRQRTRLHLVLAVRAGCMGVEDLAGIHEQLTETFAELRSRRP